VRTRLYVAAVFAAVIGAALLALLVVRLGQDDPSPPSLQDNPRLEIPGALVFIDKKGCISTIDASGENLRQVACPVGQGIQEVTWVKAGQVAYRSYGRNTGEWLSIDLATGKESVLGPGSYAYGNTSVVSSKGEVLIVDRSGDIYVEKNTVTTRIFDFKGSTDEGLPDFVTWSPDGEWVVLRYWRDNELWIIRRDATVAGSLDGLASSGPYGNFSWIIPGVGVAPARELPGGLD
jgi:hypothetical protein